MKKTFIILGIFCLFSTSHAAILLVSTSSVYRSAADTNTSSSISATINNLIVVGCGHGTTFVDPTNVTDTIGNAFTKFTNSSNTSQGMLSGYYAISSATNATDNVRCNFASSVSGRDITIAQYSGTAASPLDITARNATTTVVQNFSAGPFTTANANEVIVAFGGNTGGSLGIAAGTGYTMEASSTSGGSTSYGIEDKIVSTVQTAVSSTITDPGGTTNWIFIVGSFTQVNVEPTINTSLTVIKGASCVVKGAALNIKQ